MEIVPLLGDFLDDRFSHAVKLIHEPTHVTVYRSPFDFPVLMLREELVKRAMLELEEKVNKHSAHSTSGTS